MYTGSKETPEDSEEWSRIKNFVGGAKRAPKHPLKLEADRLNRSDIHNYDEGTPPGGVPADSGVMSSVAQALGGAIPDFLKASPYLSALSESLVPSESVMRSAGQGLNMASSALGGPSNIIDPPHINPASDNAPVKQQITKPTVQHQTVPAPPKPAPTAALAPAVSGGPETPGTDDSAEAAKIMGGVTPENMMANLQRINTPSISERIGHGMTGAADALMQGVARAGPSNFQKNYDDQTAGRKAALSGIPEKAAALGEKQFNISQTLQTQDPNSKLSKWAQEEYGPIGKKVGLNLGRASAKSISDILGLGVKEMVAGYEASAKKTEMELNMLRTKADIGHQTAEEANQAKETALNQDKEAAGHWATNPTGAFQARSRLGQGSNAQTYSPRVATYATKHGISPDEAIKLMQLRGESK